MKKILFLSLFSIILVSCIEYQEKMKLNLDGSGEITFAFGISESIFSMGGDNAGLKEFNEEKIDQNYKDKKGIKLVSKRTYTESGNRWMEAKISFDSINDLIASSTDTTQQAAIGDISLTQDSNGNMVFTRKISKEQKETEPDSSSQKVGEGMMEMMFGKYQWHYELTLPGKIVSTNANSADVDYSSNTVKWNIPIASLAKTQIMTVTFEKSTATNLTIIILGVIIVIVLAIVFFISISKKKKSE
jgi:hypothetical protein